MYIYNIYCSHKLRIYIPELWQELLVSLTLKYYVHVCELYMIKFTSLISYYNQSYEYAESLAHAHLHVAYIWAERSVN